MIKQRSSDISDSQVNSIPFEIIANQIHYLIRGKKNELPENKIRTEITASMINSLDLSLRKTFLEKHATNINPQIICDIDLSDLEVSAIILVNCAQYLSNNQIENNG